MVAVARRQQLEALAAVGGAEHAGVLGIERVDVPGVGDDRGEVPGALREPPVIVDALPVCPAVIRAVQASFRRLDHRVDAPGVRTRNRDVDAPENARGQAIAAEPRPAHTAVGGAIQSTSRTTAGEIPRLSACLPQRGVDDLRVMWVETHVDRTGLRILVQNLGPGLAAVSRAEHAALGIRTEGMPESGDQHDVRIVRIDDERADLAGILKPDTAPGLAAVDRLVDAVAV